MKGILSYIAIMGFAMVWVLGWMCLSWLIGAFFDLPMKTSSVVGATLGPMGVIAVLLLGFASRRSSYPTRSDHRGSHQFSESIDDPFA